MSLKYARGYSRTFLSRSQKVELPTLSESLSKCIARKKRGGGDGVLRYKHYSVILHQARKLPIVSAANLDGRKFKEIRRTSIFSKGRDKWRKDKRIGYNKQWGNELYIAENSHFDIGHLTKREDVQWGTTYKDAKLHASYTFYFTNAVPQHARLNQGIWRALEDYILHDETTSLEMKASVFTGPVLAENDPFFTHEVRGNRLQLPVLFWKIVYYLDAQEELCRVGFLVGQKELLEEEGVILRSRGVSDTRFMNFGKGGVFQVNVSLIEELTDCEFTPAKDVYKDDRPSELVLEAVQARGVSDENAKNTSINGLFL
jgi:endonuclease G